MPAKLSAQVRVFATGNGRKTDPVDAHSVALTALHAPNLRRVPLDPELVALGLLADRRDELGRARTQTLNRIHRILLDLVPGGAKKFLSAPQARDLLTDLRPSNGIGSPAPATAESTASYTSWPWSSCAIPPPGASTSTPAARAGRPRWKRCAHSNGDSPTPSTRGYMTTSENVNQQAREGNRERLLAPARPGSNPTRSFGQATSRTHQPS
ncbi:transposase [Nocardia sp. NPDC059228]|uniref:IS110 family transposase n=1 Tax=Nocardia sp. NPDC059228 TaxID=3346777 RepID=UPI0036CB42A2